MAFNKGGITNFAPNRVTEILKRLDVSSGQAEAMKTCFGILAILSRDESNKALIARGEHIFRQTVFYIIFINLRI